MEKLPWTQGNSSKIACVLITLSILLQLDHSGLIKCSSASVAKIRFVGIRTIHSGQWTRPSCIMEPVKRFSLDSLPGNALCKAPHHQHHHLSPTFTSHSLSFFPPLGGGEEFRWSINPSSSEFTLIIYSSLIQKLTFLQGQNHITVLSM